MIQHGKSLIMFFFDRTTSNRKKKPELEPENEDMADEKTSPLKKSPKYMNYHQPSLLQSSPKNLKIMK